MSFLIPICVIISHFIWRVHVLPPDVCFQPFKWQDCGKEPTPVMYYFKSGSRCEVGLWRGCLPNMNMFKDEYECVATCIFSVRAAPIDYHSYNEIVYKEADDVTTEAPEENDTNGTNETGNGTDNGTSNETKEEEGGGEEGHSNETEKSEGNEASEANEANEATEEPE